MTDQKIQPVFSTQLIYFVNLIAKQCAMLRFVHKIVFHHFLYCLLFACMCLTFSKWKEVKFMAVK